jgi:hypothetical protein
MNRAAIHEGAHLLVLALLNYEGIAVINRPRCECLEPIIDPVHLAAIGLAGALGELTIDHPLTSREEARRFVVESGRVSAGDWTLIGSEKESCFQGLWLALGLLKAHHSLHIHIAETLMKRGQIHSSRVSQLRHLVDALANINIPIKVAY